MGGMRRKGATIPDAGSAKKVTLCLPDTWTPIVSGLLVQPTQPWFWDNTASHEDVETACDIAHEILGKFLTPSCNSGIWQPGTSHSDLIDFRLGELEGWELIKGTVETDGLVGEVLQQGFFYSPQLELRFTFPEPALFTRVQTLGASRFTFAQSSQTFPNAEFTAWKTGYAYPLARAHVQMGQQNGASPFRMTLESNSNELCTEVVLYYDGGYYSDLEDAQGVEILIEQLQFDWYEAIP